ncbi:MAG: hypothetical protein UHP28_05265 [Treponema sp.]|nr:hypothetical protein [Treponema sp.]
MISDEMNNYPKRIVAPSFDDAKRELFEKYASNFKIEGQKTILKGGFLGFGQKKYVEVTYRTIDRAANFENVKRSPGIYSVNGAYPKNISDEAFEASKAELLKKAPVVQSNAVQNQKLEEIKQMISDLQLKPQVSSEEHPTIERIKELLSENEFSYQYIKFIVEKIKKSFPLEKLEDFDYVQRNVVDWIGETICIAPDRVARKPHVVIIVGPTGVGKTTTLVKLAAQYVLAAKSSQKSPKLCFITTDSMRVGAYEQLERYGSIFGVPVQKAENANDVKQIYDNVCDSVDAIFIDTSGYSPNDASHIGNMKMTLDVQGLNPDIYLAVMASSKARDLANIMKNYEPFGYNSVIITKCDESEQYGNIISVLHEKHKSVSYITNGQQPAGFIEKANVVDFLIRLENFKVDRVHIEDKFGEQ